MKILDTPITVDVQKQLIAVNAELHADLETFLREHGSEEKYLYGINILDDGDVEYDSLINITRNRDAGYPRARRTVADETVRNEIDKIVRLWIRK